MKLENRFTVPVPIAEAWKVLLDVERIAPCLPGATLTERNGDTFAGTVKVKVGPINLTYGGKAKFVSLDDTNYVAVLEGTGKETRGTGTAKATVTCRLLDQGASTDVEVDTDLAVTGKPASFGRGVLADVSGKLVDQFAASLSEEILAGTPTPTPAQTPTPTDADADADAATGSAAAPSPSQPGAASSSTATVPAATATSSTATVRPPRPEAEPINLMETAGAPVLKRLAPIVAGVVALIWLALRARR